MTRPALLGSLDGGIPPAPKPRKPRGRQPKHPHLTHTAKIVAADPVLAWLVFELPYARPSAVRSEFSRKADLLVSMGLLETDPSTKVSIYRCTEKGEDVAQQLLRAYGRQRT